MKKNNCLDIFYRYWPKHLIHNFIALIGFITSMFFRLWGFNAFLCALILMLTGARTRQYIGIIASELVYTGILYFFLKYPNRQQLMLCIIIYAITCVTYWFLTLEKPCSKK